MAAKFFIDFSGNTASITDTGKCYLLICRDYYGRNLKHSAYASEESAKSALLLLGEDWRETLGPRHYR